MIEDIEGSYPKVSSLTLAYLPTFQPIGGSFAILPVGLNHSLVCALGHL